MNPNENTSSSKANHQPSAGGVHSISDSKLVNFAIGTQKKSRFQKEREANEAKRKLDEADAAKVYESFVASFADDDDAKTFVRGGRDEGPYQMNKRTKTSETDNILDEFKVSSRFLFYAHIAH